MYRYTEWSLKNYSNKCPSHLVTWQCSTQHLFVSSISWSTELQLYLILARFNLTVIRQSDTTTLTVGLVQLLRNTSVRPVQFKKASFKQITCSSSDFRKYNWNIARPVCRACVNSAKLKHQLNYQNKNIIQTSAAENICWTAAEISGPIPSPGIIVTVFTWKQYITAHVFNIQIFFYNSAEAKILLNNVGSLSDW